MTACSMIEAHAHPDDRSQCKRSALHIAARGSAFAVGRLLIDAQADVNAEDFAGMTPLYFAVARSTEMTSLLIEARAKIDGVSPHLGTPLHSAIYARNCAPAEVLIEGRADIMARQPGKGVSLYFAVLYSNLDMVRLLVLEGGAPIEYVDKYSHTTAAQDLQAQILPHRSYSEEECILNFLDRDMRKCASDALHAVFGSIVPVVLLDLVVNFVE